MAVVPRYRAFLSYSHRDSLAAKRLHARIEGFRIDKDLVGRDTVMGPVPKHLRPVFRDRHDFDAGGPLREQTIAALDDAAAFILLASPASAASKPVDEEVRLFRSRHPDRPLIPLILDGDPGDPKHECFPPALREVGGVLAADLRETGDGSQLALAKIVARLLGLPPDEVFRRARREARRRRFRLWGMVASAPPAVALVAFVGWAGLIWWEVRQVEAEMSFVTIPAGCFNMGSPDSVPDERPVHPVCLKAFELGKFEVTQGQWHRVMMFLNNPNPSHSGRGTNLGASDREHLPVEYVTWDDAQSFVRLMSFFGRGQYRLPSESEWEYAARAGTNTPWYWGNRAHDGCAYENIADCDRPSVTTAMPVGAFKPNQWGLYDMLGNVANWVDDCYVGNYENAPKDGSAVIIKKLYRPCGPRWFL